MNVDVTDWGFDFACSLLRFGVFLILFTQSRSIARFLPLQITSELIKRERSKLVYETDPFTQFHPIKPNKVLDVCFGPVYLFYYPSPIVFMLLLAFVNPIGIVHFARVFSWACLLLGVITQLVPLSPPWRVFPFVRSSEGVVVTSRHEAGFARFDEITGLRVFRKIYSGSPQLDGCMPSGHSMWACIMLLCALKDATLPWWPFAIYTLLVIAAAIFSQHHYLVDCIAGCLLAAVSVQFAL